MDHLPGAAWKFHRVSDKPLVASKTPFLLFFEYGDGLVFFGPGDVLRASRTRCGKRGEDDFALGQ
jgi:hypothetical protein